MQLQVYGLRERMDVYPFSILGRIGGDATLPAAPSHIGDSTPFSILGRIGGDATPF